MRGEVRAATVNVVNPTDEPLDCTLAVEGLGPDTPLDCREVVFTDTAWFRCVSGALVAGDGDKVKFSIPAGISKQAWIAVNRPKGRAGLRRGRIVARFSNGATLTRPFEVRVRDLDFPAAPRCHAGGWDYLDSVGVGGKGGWYNTPSNLAARVAIHKEMYIDTAWGTVKPDNPKFDAAGGLVSQLDFTRWDKWVNETYPTARIYAIFWNTQEKFLGEKAGTPRFMRMVREYLQAWGEHARKNGCAGKRILHLTVDEPGSVKKAELSILWMRAIKAAGVPEFGIYADPIFNETVFDQISPEFWDLCDVICPHSCGEKMAAVLRKRPGKELWLYSAFGPSRTFDPATYYRMQPWRAFLRGGCGTFYWALGAACSGTSWNAYAQKGTEYSPYFASKTDVTPAKQSEAIRESIQDFEYLSLLCDKGEKEKSLAIARRVVSALPDADPDWDLSGNLPRGIADEACAEMLDELERLKKQGR